MTLLCPSAFAMLPFFSVLCVLASTIHHALAMPNTRRVDATLGAPLLPPTQDPWYTAPQGFEWARPGTVLRIRQAPGNITSQLGGNCTAAYNLLYRTTDGLYKPSWAVTTIFVPATTTAALPSYQIWMDSSALDASPSYLLSLDEGAKFHADITDSLSRGWFFNVPDYEGPLAAFGNGIQAGHAVLDSIRATFNAARDIGLSTTAMHAMWGYSGGSLASNWAAELAEQYAPEMRFSGVALGGLVPNGTSLMRTINGGPYPGLIASCLMGSAAQVPEFKAWLDSRLKTTGPHNATGLYKANNLTVLGATNEYANQDIGDYFIGGQVDVYGPEVTAFNNRFALWGYHGVPRMPTYVYKAIKDEISVVADADAVVQRYCQVGANILYHKNTVGGHNAEIANGKPHALEFLSSVLSGTAQLAGFPTTGCFTQIVVHNITDSPI